MFKSTEMNKDLTIKMMEEDVVPAILGKCGNWAKSIVVIMDNAGGHGGGRGDMSTTTLAELNDWATKFIEAAKKSSKYKQLRLIEFKAQSPRSPDMNVLDAGAWWSLQVAVDEVDDETDRSASEIVIHDAVLKAWNTWINKDKIQKLFDDVLLNCKEIIRTNGGNLYQQPHRSPLHKTQ